MYKMSDWADEKAKEIDVYSDDGQELRDSIAQALRDALAHERELLPCGHPKACWVKAIEHEDESVTPGHCSWCESLAHERQRVVEEFQALQAEFVSSADEAKRLSEVFSARGDEVESRCQGYEMDAYAHCGEKLAAFIKRLEEGK